jgi:hypothetical protein
MRRLAVAATALAMVLWAAADARASQMLVVSDSGSIGYARGSVLEDGANVKIPAGERVAFIDADGRGLTVRGPFDGPVRSAGGPQQSPAVFAAVKAILDPAVNVSIGASRKAGDGPQPPDPSLIDVSDDATVCVASAGSAQLWRPTPTRRTTLFITRLSSGDRAELDWPANQPTVAWPEKIQIVDGESYQMALTGAMSKPRLTIKLLAPGDSSVDSAKRLSDAGCRGQALTMLEAVASQNQR